MNEKAQAAQQKAQQERKRGQHARAVKRLEQAIATFPDELDLYLDAVDACLEGGEVMQATQFLKTAHEKFVKDKDRLAIFVRDKLTLVHDPALARFAVENAVKLRNLETALDLLSLVPEHTTRDLLSRTKTKKQTLKSASHGGYTLRAELVTNDLMEALLSIRVGNLKEAMTAIVQLLDEKPVEYKTLAPFLLAMDATAKSGRVRFAHACALLAGNSEGEAIVRLVEAARLEPPVAALSVDRLKAMRETTKTPAKVERALAEVLLLKGDFDEAAAVLRTYLAENQKDNKEVGREIMLLLRPFIDPANGVNECTWVSLEAAMTLEQSNSALEILRPLHQRGGCTAQLLDWLETRSKEGFLTNEMMMFQATLALEEKRWERASEILRAVCKTSPADATMALTMIDRHRSSHASLEALFKEFAAPEPTEEMRAADGDFQNFDNTEFQLSVPIAWHRRNARTNRNQSRLRRARQAASPR